MSHIVTITTRVKDPAALGLACQRLGLAAPVTQTVRLFSGAVFGHAVQLSGWRYPVVFDPETGQAHYDNYSGRWGQEAELHKLLQRYAVEKTRLEARQKGYLLLEEALQDGSIKLTIQLNS